MKMYKETFTVETEAGKATYVDITPQLREIVKKSGIENGLLTMISPHTTCAVFFEEFVHDYTDEGDEFLQVDLNHVLEKIIPDHTDADTYIYPGEEHYKCVEAWPNAAEYLPDGDRRALWNGDSHLKATLIGSSQMVDVTAGDLGVGSTGYFYFVDYDKTRERVRKCQVTVFGV
ncbi:YjbQ family protein [Streptococcus respiraculi]|uniref:YjbQ family protein n=1 Tax=Streptococcus respiraculi TaxID=2021971 RepID=UPI000E76E694|nr:YjbQ family protein [Streptococcus respiraculi]